MVVIREQLRGLGGADLLDKGVKVFLEVSFEVTSLDLAIDNVDDGFRLDVDTIPP